MKILIACPAARFIESECFVSIFNLDREGLETEFTCVKGYGVAEARNLIADYALQKSFDYLLWVDADIILPSNALKRLLSREREIISGLYSFKELGCRSVCAFIKSGSGKYAPLSARAVIDRREVIEVDAFGFGCVLMSASVLRKLKAPLFGSENGLGEDVYFCEKARAEGIELYADSTVLCGHIGEVNFNLKGAAR